MTTSFTQWLQQLTGNSGQKKTIAQILHLDLPLLCGLLALLSFGLFILYSASNQNLDIVIRQIVRIGLALAIMLILAQIPPNRYRALAPWLFGMMLVFLVIVLVVGHIGKGAQRWLNLGLFRFQPAEIMKLALPMVLAWYLHARPLPIQTHAVFICGVFILFPAMLVAKQPDLGTALLIVGGGASIMLLAGLRWKWLLALFLLVAACTPLAWHFMHDYQRDRVLTFLNPEHDPLGRGYHIIQSKIAIGSGGVFGKGWLQGTQSHLQFLPEHTTDFIFAVCGEELGLMGNICLIIIYLLIIGRGLYISMQAPDTFSRLLAGSLIMMFFISMLVNMGMVMGILPVVGVPLPLVSYGGTSVVTVLASFGIIMALHTHRRLVQT